MNNGNQPLKDKIHDNPENFVCCHCKTPMLKRMSTTGDGSLRKGLILVCASCAKPNVLGDSGLHPLTKEEFSALPLETRRQLLVTAQGIKGFIETGGSWNPYQNQ